jgi:hypothetical protein
MPIRPRLRRGVLDNLWDATNDSIIRDIAHEERGVTRYWHRDDDDDDDDDGVGSRGLSGTGRTSRSSSVRCDGRGQSYAAGPTSRPPPDDGHSIVIILSPPSFPFFASMIRCGASGR